MPKGDELRRRIKILLVEELMLDVRPEEIEDETPIFATGLGLDSVDALQLVIVLDKNFGLKIADAEQAKAILGSVDRIAAEIEKRET